MVSTKKKTEVRAVRLIREYEATAESEATVFIEILDFYQHLPPFTLKKKYFKVVDNQFKSHVKAELPDWVIPWRLRVARAKTKATFRALLGEEEE